MLFLRYSCCNSDGMLLYPSILLSACSKNLLSVSLFEVDSAASINAVISFSNSHLDIFIKSSFHLSGKMFFINWLFIKKGFTVLKTLIADVLIKQVPHHVRLQQLCASCSIFKLIKYRRNFIFFYNKIIHWQIEDIVRIKPTKTQINILNHIFQMWITCPVTHHKHRVIHKKDI